MITSIVDFIKSGFGLFRYIKIGRKIDQQQLEINELQLKRLREEEVIRKQADLIIQLNNEGRESFLIIKNQGIAVAKNCRIIGIDKLIYDINTILPCDILPNEEIQVTITHTKDTPSSAHIVCIWDDEYGDSRKCEKHLSFY